MPEKTDSIRVHDVAPMPYDRENWTAETLIKHYAARAASLNEATHRSVSSHPRDTDSPAFQRAVLQTARLSESANAHLAAALLLRIIATRTAGIHALIEDTLTELWEVTPEAGALDGEWVDAANDIIGHYGIEGWQIAPEPCDLDNADGRVWVSLGETRPDGVTCSRIPGEWCEPEDDTARTEATAKA